ncbi:XRE family transcriptional regulator [Weissella muntiaci]|uniref:XRE family transcriptional regulator n=1 Tax=Weissella muntiaci TaxID=2508881 RepID=A0A6C2C4K7_9LACO|nr:helix-turn-helix transcriptional regulator [Weissella muntiaci]TYC48848.1 XRE family transcriptional regulator [Weissella muntiaci]
MTIFERTKELAKEKGFTLRQLEEKAGLGTKSIYSWKNYTPRGSNLQAVADVLNVSVDYLLGNTDEKKSSQNEPTDKDLEDAFIGAEAYDGKPITDHDKEVIKALIKGYLNTKEG